MYAKMALLMFYPFRQLTDLTCKKNYWKKFHQELTKHNKKDNTIFWKEGFEILQNIQDRDTLQKYVRCARDPICMVTVNEKPDEKKYLKVKVRCQNKTMLKIYCKWVTNWGKCCGNGLANYSEYEYFDWQALLKNLTVYSDDEWGFDESDSKEIYSHTKKIHTAKLSINVILVRGI